MNDDVFELLKQVNRLSEKQDALRTELMERMDKVEQGMSIMFMKQLGSGLLANGIADIIKGVVSDEKREKLEALLKLSAALNGKEDER